MKQGKNKSHRQLFVVFILVGAVAVTLYAVKEFSSPYSRARTPRTSIKTDVTGDYAGFARTSRTATTRTTDRTGVRGSGEVSPEIQSAVCEKAVSRFRDKLAEYDVRKEERLARYEETKESALNMLDTMDEMGYNTELARQNISMIDGKVATLVAELDGIVAKWQNKNIDCSDAASYEAIMAEAQADLAKVRSMVEEITLLAQEAINSILTQVEVQ